MRKNYLFVLLIFISFYSFSQEKEPKSNSQLSLKSVLRLNMMYPIHFGDNALSKAHQSNIGFSGQFAFLNYQKFNFGIGYDRSNHKITDKQIIANIEKSEYSSFYGLLSYDYEINKKLHISPCFGYGKANLDLSYLNSRFGGQNGAEFRFGFQTDYKIGKATFASLGLTYISTNYSINTVPEYVDFFKKSRQIQLSLGFRLGN